MKSEYYSIQQHTSVINGEGKSQVMEVKIKNGKGHKKVTYKNSKGKTLSTDSQNLTSYEIEDIMSKKFVPGLFETCLTNCKNSMIGGDRKIIVRSSKRRTRRRKN
jgi:hypothetical protein